MREFSAAQITYLLLHITPNLGARAHHIRHVLTEKNTKLTKENTLRERKTYHKLKSTTTYIENLVKELKNKTQQEEHKRRQQLLNMQGVTTLSELVAENA